MVAGRFSDYQAPAIRIASHAKETVQDALGHVGLAPDRRDAGQAAARKSVRRSPKHRRRCAALATQLA